MYYNKKETYIFTMPKEHTALLKFKDDLKAMGVKYTEEGGSNNQIITISTSGRFNTEEEQWTTLF